MQVTNTIVITYKRTVYLSMLAMWFACYFILSNKKDNPNNHILLWVTIAASLFMYPIFVKVFSQISNVKRVLHVKLLHILGLGLLIPIVANTFIYIYYIRIFAHDHFFSIISAGFFSIALTIIKISLLLFIFTLISYGVGDFALNLFTYNLRENSIKHFIRLGIGIYTICMIIFFQSVVHILWLVPWTILLFSIVCIIHYRKPLTAILQKKILLSFHPETASDQVALLLTGVFILMCYIGFSHFSYFSIAADDWRTYMNIPLTYIQHNGFTLFPYYPPNNIQFLGTYLIIPLEQLVPGSSSILCAYLFALSLGALIIGLHQKFHIRGTVYGTIITLLLTLNPWVLSTVRPEAFILFFCALAVTLLFNLAQPASKKYIILIGFFLGAAFMAKYNALFIAPAIIMLIFWLGPKKRILHTLSLIILGAIIAYAPFAMFNYYYFHNPIYPYFQNGSLSMASLNPFIAIYFKEKKVLYDYSNEYMMIQDNRISPLMNPVEKLSVISLIQDGWPVNNLGPIILVLLLTVLLFVSKEKNFYVIFSAFAASYILWDRAQINQFHYLYMLLPLIAFLLGYELMMSREKFLSYAVILLMLISYLLTPQLSAFKSTMHLANNRQFIDKQMQSFYFKNADLLNTLEDKYPDYRIMLFNDNFYTPRIRNNERHIVMNMNNTAWLQVVAQSQNTSEALTLLQKSGITYIALDRKPPYIFTNNCSSTKCPLHNLLNIRLEQLTKSVPVETENNDIAVYRIASM